MGALVFACCAHAPLCLGQDRNPAEFTTDTAGEAVAELQMAGPGSDWGGRSPAAVADVLVDGAVSQQVVLFAGPSEYTYPISLGALEAGSHRLEVRRNDRYSAAGAGVRLRGAKFRTIPESDPEYPVFAHAPLLYARDGSLEQFTDVPLSLYCERFTGAEGTLLRYTTIFSNEDGGTSTRALMARWGRAVDIEWTYEVRLGSGPAEGRYQAENHQVLSFPGPFSGLHPRLRTLTLNNMLGPATGDGPLFRPAPAMARLSAASRESMVDQSPVFYRVMAQELAREGKLRPYGKPEGEKISDPKNYLYVEMRVDSEEAAVFAIARRKGNPYWHASHLGEPLLGIERAGWVRTAIEMPPGMKAPELAEIGFGCEYLKKNHAEGAEPDGQGLCRVWEVGKVFLLDDSYQPGPPVWRLPNAGRAIELQPGQLRTFAVMGAAK